MRTASTRDAARGFVLLLAFAFSCAAFAAGDAEPVTRKSESIVGSSGTAGTGAWVPGQVIVRFRQRVETGEAGSLLDPLRFRPGRLLVRALDIYLVELLGNLEVEQALRLLRRDPDVLYAQPDHLLELRLTFPDDPSFASQWALDNPDNDADIDAPEAWDFTTEGVDPGGDPVVVAIVDSGMELSHPDLAPVLWINEGETPGNGLDDDDNGYVDDVNGWDAYQNDGTIPNSGHGTHVGGISGARGNNGNQVCGVNWDIRLMAVAASSGQTSIVIAGYGYVLDQKLIWLESEGGAGANVVSSNSSFGVNYGDCESPNYEAWNDLYDAMGEAGILSTAATMNINADVDVQGDVPTGCSSDYLIAVTNTTDQDVRNSGAAYGLESIDLGAPGTHVLSTYTGGGTQYLTGTSMAAPHVAGAVAFLHCTASQDLYGMIQEDPAVAALEIKRMILEGTDPLASLDGITVSGGRLNLRNSGALARNFDLPFLPFDLQIARKPGNRVDLSWLPIPDALMYYVEEAQNPWGTWGTWTRLDSTQELSWSRQVIHGSRCYRVIAELPDD